ncbi:tRNA (N6-isopentenyl adenosine(37)-C2)-methylthiotransferase MiaB [Humitalea sp. 24SJ18S-53]|uniref:tRNA (N6-isopentenyl adenosine(37)-C2)-methylthiotransferase MiaB n=1 Tax=Humitalea sp. 24SJ18S-53 TaxID=3422307 RepID=UPI003D66439F
MTAPTTVAPPRRLHVRTWGCQMNVYDSERMTELLAPLGYAPVDTPDAADMVLLNTCHIRERATEKVFSDLGRLRDIKNARAADGQKMLIAVAGCVAQAEGAEIAARAPWVDLVVGPQSYHRLPEMVARAHRAAGVQIDTDFPAETKFDTLPEARGKQGAIAFLTVQEGCDKFCSFCVVPYTRGAEASRPPAAVLAEARRLVAAGAREIALLGQNVNAYHGDGWDLARLLRALAEIPGLARLRYATSHPRDFQGPSGEALIAAHGDLPALMPYLHLPVQAGSDRVLRAMNRGHTADDFRRVVDKLRVARPDIALTSDFIVGHPGESDADFQATMRLVEETGFAMAYSFTYSQRPGTPAAALPGQVPQADRDARLQALQALLRRQQDAFNADCVGREAEVLVIGTGRDPGQLSARSPWLQAVHFQGSPSLIGQVVRVRLVTALTNSLTATLCATLEQEELSAA